MANALNTWTGALFALFVTTNLAEAQSLVDKHPTYRQHAEGFIVDKIEYRDQETVVFFRYAGSEYSSATFYQPKHNLAWFLRDDKGNVYELKSLQNLSRNGSVLHKEVIETTYLNGDWETSTRTKLQAACELHFDKLAEGVKKIDLVEGKGREGWSNHFNAFDIQVKTKEVVAAETANPELTKNNVTPPVAQQEIVYSDDLSYLEDIQELTPDAWDEAINEEEPLDEHGNPLGGMSYREVGELDLEGLQPEDFLLPAYPEELFDALEAPVSGKVAAAELSDKIKTQKRVKYDTKATRNVYEVNKIEYHEKDMVVHFSFADAGYPSGTFYGPEGQHAWFLKDKDGNVYKSKAVNNLRFNNQLVADGISTQVRVADEVEYEYDFSSRPRKNTSSCEIVFDRLPKGVEIVDLIEGTGREQWSNHFNVFGIKVKTFNTPEPEVAVEPVLVEVKPETPAAKVETPAAVVSNYSIFPNPNKGAFNLLNNGAAQKEAFVQVLDLNGKVLLSQQVQIEEKASQKFNIQNLSAGQYLVRVQNGDKTVETLQMIVAE